MHRPLLLAGLILCGGCTRAPQGPAPRQIHIVGSIAAYGASTAAAERLMRERPEVIAPLVQADGTTGGIARLCAGAGPRQPDIVGATRAMTAAERAACRTHGVASIETVTLGRTAFVAVVARGAPALALTRAALARALAGPAATWAAIDPALPAAAILIAGPARSVADDLTGPVLPAGTRLRGDAAYRGHGADAGLIAGDVVAHPGTIGILPYDQALARADTLRILPLDGVAPAPATIASGAYPAAAPLLLLVRRGGGGRVPGLALLLEYYRAATEASRL